SPARSPTRSSSTGHTRCCAWSWPATAAPTPPPSAPAPAAPISCSSSRVGARSARRTPRSPPPTPSCSPSATPTRAGRPPRYALLVASHRILRYATPFLHVALLAASVRRPRALGAQATFLAAAASGRTRAGLVARYYVLTTASIALGLYDWLRHGTEAGW